MIKKIIVLIILVSASNFALAALPGGNIIEKIYFKPIVVMPEMVPGGYTLIPVKGFYFKIPGSELTEKITKHPRDIYISTVWTVLSVLLFFGVRKIYFKKRL